MESKTQVELLHQISNIVSSNLTLEKMLQQLIALTVEVTFCDACLVYLVDRVKDMINRGGENVYCVEVENALAGAPGVYEAAVLGVPDEMMGEKVGAVIVPMPGAALDVPAVLGYLGEHIADFKVPQYVAVSATPLPRNPGGKLLKRRLREDVDWAAAFRR